MKPKPPCHTRAAEQARDLARLNAAADRLNTEMTEVLRFQADWPDEEEDRVSAPDLH